MSTKGLNVKEIMAAQKRLERAEKSGKVKKVKPNNSKKYRKLVEEANERDKKNRRQEAETWIHARNFVARSSKVVTPEFTSGDVRLGMGLVRDSEEQEEYVQKSLKKTLP